MDLDGRALACLVFRCSFTCRVLVAQKKPFLHPLSLTDNPPWPVKTLSTIIAKL